LIGSDEDQIIQILVSGDIEYHQKKQYCQSTAEPQASLVIY
jgi:hypothetical protein